MNLLGPCISSHRANNLWIDGDGFGKPKLLSGTALVISTWQKGLFDGTGDSAGLSLTEFAIKRLSCSDCLNCDSVLLAGMICTFWDLDSLKLLTLSVEVRLVTGKSSSLSEMTITSRSRRAFWEMPMGDLGFISSVPFRVFTISEPITGRMIFCCGAFGRPPPGDDLITSGPVWAPNGFASTG